MEQARIASLDITLKSAFRNLKSAILLGALLFALSLPAQAQQPKKVPRIGLLTSASTAVVSPCIDAFRQGLRELATSRGKTSFSKSAGVRRSRVDYLTSRLN
jgi:hypothetical protein